MIKNRQGDGVFRRGGNIMNDLKEFYKATMNKPVSGLISKFFNWKYSEKLTGNKAVDLGCGTGNDTEFLISKGFKVTAIDSEEQVKDILDKKITDKTNLEIVIGDFSKIEIPKADLILANMSLFFVKDNFDEFIKKLLQKVNEKGFIVANFLGKEDDWDGKRTTIEKEKLLEYFKDFDINYFSEEKYYKETSLGKNKFWHVYTIIAQAK